MIKQLLAITFSFFPVLLFCHSIIASEASPPNVLIILADDQGWGDLSIQGNTNLKTPNIDSLANAGVTFDRFYACPLCAPTRAELLTGRYHIRSGVVGVTSGKERMNLEEKTIAEMFAAAGYKTALFGKWHNGSQYPYHPKGRGFQEYFGFTSGHWGNYFDPILEDNGKLVHEKGYITDILTDKTLSFLDKNQENPFFCFLALNTPHSPFQVPDEYWNRMANNPIELRGNQGKDEDIAVTRCALAMSENIDWNVGRIVKKIDELKLDKNTIIIYLSDNGPNSWRWNDGMKGRKGAVDEGGVRVPFFIRWKDHLPSGIKVAEIAGVIDLLPTLAMLTGLKPLGTLPLDGIDISPLMFGKTNNWQDRTIISQNGNKLSVRNKQFRYSNGNLYDMQKDPGQQTNLTPQQPADAAYFARLLDNWKTSVRFEEPHNIPPIPVGYHEYPWTPLPARDATFAGTVKRSASAPNCSYITNWSSSEDKIAWQIDIHEDGEYDAAIYYTCPEEEIGSTVTLRCDANEIKTTLTVPFDPPFVSAIDRIPRTQESYVKEFKVLPMGKIKLKKGIYPLELFANPIARKQVADVWGISLTLCK